MVGLHVGRIQPIVAKLELYKVALGRAHRAVVLHRQVLQHLHQSPLHVARLCGLHSGIDEALTATHGVEEKLRRGQAREEGVGDEALCGWVLGLWLPASRHEHGHSNPASTTQQGARTLTWKMGSVRSTNPSAIRAPFTCTCPHTRARHIVGHWPQHARLPRTFCWPTHATI